MSLYLRPRDDLRRVERELCSIHGKAYCCMVGSATGAIAVALQAAGVKRKGVALPNAVCLNVPMAVLFSDNEPFYLDISKDDLGLDPQHLAENAEQVAAVIAVHSHGATCQIRALQKICRENSIFLIEDCAVAEGAAVDGQPAGSFGDVAVVSFGAGKIVDVGHGGAILSDDRHLMREVRRHLEDWPAHSPELQLEADAFSRFHTTIYNRHYPRDVNRFHGEFLARIKQIGRSFMYGFDPSYADAIENGLTNLHENIDSRRRKRQLLHEKFGPIADFVSPFIPPAGSVDWRCSAFAHENRDGLLHMLLRKGYRVSSWHPPADLFLRDGSQHRPNTPVSDHVGKTILNFWVNDDADELYINSIADEVISFFSGRL